MVIAWRLARGHPTRPAEVRYVRVGESGENLAITALALRALGTTPQLFAAVTNTGSQPAETILSLEADGELLERRAS